MVYCSRGSLSPHHRSYHGDIDHHIVVTPDRPTDRPKGHPMGTIDELLASFGPDALARPETARSMPHAWHGLCVCGHLDRYHSPSIGGTFRLATSIDRVMPNGGRMIYEQLFHGCRGAMVNRNVPLNKDDVQRTGDTMVRKETLLATCPCVKFREVAQVDRPNRYFNQRMPVIRTNPVAHPFMVGIRAFMTFLSRRRAALSDPSWATAEFDRRFQWTRRTCEISRCTRDG